MFAITQLLFFLVDCTHMFNISVNQLQQHSGPVSKKSRKTSTTGHMKASIKFTRSPNFSEHSQNNRLRFEPKHSTLMTYQFIDPLLVVARLLLFARSSNQSETLHESPWYYVITRIASPPI